MVGGSWLWYDKDTERKRLTAGLELNFPEPGRQLVSELPALGRV